MALSPYHHIIQAATEHHGRSDNEDSDHETSFSRKSNHMPLHNNSDLEIGSDNNDENIMESGNDNELEYKSTLRRMQPVKRSRNALLNDSRESHTDSEDYDNRRLHDRTNNLSIDNLEKASFDKQTSLEEIHSPELHELRKLRSANSSPIATAKDINSTAEPSLHDDSSLANTNRLISDLERKLSIMSTSSSNHTQQSQGSSVIVNKSLAGMGKELIQSSVLQYIKSEEDKARDTHNNIFNPNELFQDRQLKFLTKFGKLYNDDNQRKMVNPNHHRLDAHLTGEHIPDENASDNVSPVITPNLAESSLDAVEVDDPIGMDTDSLIHISRDDSHIAEHSFVKEKEDILDQDEDEDINDEDDHEEHANHSGMYGIFFNDNSYDDDFDPDDNDDDDNFEPTDELLLPPSPPRSPPRDLDPDKLYGLYDFSGPDPSHCSLTRDEPVYLINDQDNYWWLIRKLNKEERKMHVKLKRRINQGEIDEDYDSLEDDYTDEEDGKIGFVPAECLETYGERLARLNCFKNEELERSSKDSLVDQHLFGNTAQQGESQVFQSEDNLLRDNDTSIILNKSEGLLRSSSLLKRSGSKKNNKSVTFENLADLQLHEEEEEVEEQTDDTDLIRKQQKKAGFEANSMYNIPQEDIRHSDGQQDQDEEKRSEVLSDVYPVETPLIINKNGKSNNKKKLALLPSTLTQDTVLPLNPSHSLEQPHEPAGSFKGFLSKPPTTSNTFDQASIGSFSPDTPPSRFVKSYTRPSHLLDSPGDELDEVYMSPNLGMLRRSEILDRLTKVTSDIEEQLAFSDFEADGNEEGYEEDANVTKEHESDRLIVDLSSPHSIKEKHRGVVIVDDDDYEDGDILDADADADADANADADVSDFTKSEDCDISKSDIEKEIKEIHPLPVEETKEVPESPKDILQEIPQHTPQEKSEEAKEPTTEIKQSASEMNQEFDGSTLEKGSEVGEINPEVVVISDDSSPESSLPEPASLSTPSKSDDISDDIPNDSINMGAIEEAAGTTPVSLSSKDSAATITDVPSESLDHVIHSSPITKQIDSSSEARRSPDIGKSVQSMNVPERDEEEEEDDDDDDEYDDDDVLNGGYPADITPLTSMNSLNYGQSSTPTPSKLVPPTDVSDKRKSRPVHDMFMPILGKFDELAEKLAELDGML